jgi:hypothetical protein
VALDTQAFVNPDISPGGGVGMLSEETSALSAQENETEQSRTVKVDGIQGKAVVKEFKWPINENLPSAKIIALEEIFDEYRDVFAFDASELGIIEGETYHIKLTDETPIFKQQYRLSQSEKEILQGQMEERKAVGFIRTSTSDWAAPVMMPPKKDENGNWTLKRPCVDYRALNSRMPTVVTCFLRRKRSLPRSRIPQSLLPLIYVWGIIKFGLLRKIVARRLSGVWMVCINGL